MSSITVILLSTKQKHYVFYNFHKVVFTLDHKNFMYESSFVMNKRQCSENRDPGKYSNCNTTWSTKNEFEGGHGRKFLKMCDVT
ncbi:unnamed protein product [Tenebrio molitor]|nr:unnamed protein product [Tenebrio molitor]